MKKLFTIFFSLLSTLCFSQDGQYSTVKQLRLRNNTDSTSTAATTDGTIFYSKQSNQFRFRQNGAWVSFLPTSSANFWKTTGTTTVTSPTIVGSVTFDGKIQFTPSATLSGLNLGSFGGSPSTLSNGDIWYNTNQNIPAVYTGSETRFFVTTQSVGNGGNVAYFDPVTNSAKLSHENAFNYSAATNTLAVDRVKTNGSSTLAGVNVGVLASDPSALTNGDLWYNSSSATLKARIGGSTKTLISGSTSGVANVILRSDGTDGATLKFSVASLSDNGSLSTPGVLGVVSDDYLDTGGQTIGPDSDHQLQRIYANTGDVDGNSTTDIGIFDFSTLKNNSTIVANILITGVNSDGSSGFWAVIKLGYRKTNAGTLTKIGTEVVDSDEDMDGALTFSTVLSGNILQLRISDTGSTGTWNFGIAHDLLVNNF